MIVQEEDKVVFLLLYFPPIRLMTFGSWFYFPVPVSGSGILYGVFFTCSFYC